MSRPQRSEPEISRVPPELNWRSIALLAFLAVVWATAAGCIFEDRSRFSERILWGHAAVVASALEGQRTLDLQPGDKWIFELTDGWTHGRWSTAHGSHDSVYLILKQEPKAGAHYTFSLPDGDLEYDGFAGYTFKHVDATKPATAQMVVQNVGARKISAEVSIQVWCAQDRISGFAEGSEAGPSERLEITGTQMFRRQNK